MPLITDILRWRAVYSDDPEKPEYLCEVERKDGRTREHAFKEIDMKRIIALELVNEKDVPIFKIILGDDKRIIYAKRKMKRQGRRIFERDTKDPKTGEIKKIKIPVPINTLQTVIVIGWQKTVNGKNVQAINYIYPDGRIELGSDWGKDAIHSEVSPVKALENKA